MRTRIWSQYPRVVSSVNRCGVSQLRYKESNNDLLLNKVVRSRSDHYKIHYQLTVELMLQSSKLVSQGLWIREILAGCQRCVVFSL